YGRYLRQADDIARLDRLVWDGKEEAVHRMLPRVDPGHRAEALARLALANVSQTADKLRGQMRAQASGLQQDPGLLFGYMRLHRSKENYDAAISQLRQAPKDLVRPQLWWQERELLARHLLQEGKTAEAYDLISKHGMTEGPNFADAEFLAGW